MFRAANTKTEQQTRTPPPEKREVEPPSTECTRFEKFAKHPHAIGHGRGPIPRRRGTSVAGSRDQLEHFCYRHTSRQAQTRHRVSSISGKITGISICGTSARATEVVFSLRPPTADRLSRNPGRIAWHRTCSIAGLAAYRRTDHGCNAQGFQFRISCPIP